jgi:hypothetical protein
MFTNADYQMWLRNNNQRHTPENYQKAKAEWESKQAEKEQKKAAEKDTRWNDPSTHPILGTLFPPRNTDEKTGRLNAPAEELGSTHPANNTEYVSNTVKGVANAKPGQKITRSNGTVITLKWADINYARKQLGMPTIDPTTQQESSVSAQSTVPAQTATSVQQSQTVKKMTPAKQTTSATPATTPISQQKQKTYSRNNAVELGIIKADEPSNWTASVNTSPKNNAKLNRLLGIPANYQGMLSFDASGIRTDKMTKPIPYSTKNAQLIRSILGTSSGTNNTVSDVALKNVAKALTKYRW